MAKNQSVNVNFSWLGLVGVVFVVAKVFEIGVVATWSWWLVLLPFYIGLAIVVGLFFGAAILAALVMAMAWVADGAIALWRKVTR